MTATERDRCIEEEHHEIAGGLIAEAARDAGDEAEPTATVPGPATPAEALRDLAHRMHYRAEDGDCPSDCAAMANFAAEVNRWAAELDAAPAADCEKALAEVTADRDQRQQLVESLLTARRECEREHTGVIRAEVARLTEERDGWRDNAVKERELVKLLTEQVDRLAAARATVPGPAAPTTYALPPGITFDIVCWHCSRCGKRSTWVRDEVTDPLAEAEAEAFGHHANHEQWAAERLSTVPPAGTPCSNCEDVDPASCPVCAAPAGTEAN